MSKIKVLILHNYMTPYRFPLFREISKDPRIDLTVYFMSRSARNRRWKKLPKLGFKYKILPKVELSYLGRDLFAYIINYTFPFIFFKENFDVVISAGWLDFASQAAFLLCKLTSKKFIIWSESTMNEKSWRRTLTLPFVKYLVRNSDACIAIGTLSKEYLISLGANPEKISIAYSTVDVNYFMKESNISQTKKIKLKESYKIQTKKVVLYVGQFIERKGMIYLIKAFQLIKRKYKDVSLVLVGYGPLKKELEYFVKREKIKDVIFIDHVEVKKMPKIYAMADIFVLPSLEETWGLVVNEAMASGLPVITTDKVGSHLDLIIKNKNGYVVKAGSANHLSERMKELLLNEKRLKRMSESSSEVIRNYTPQKAAKVFIKSILDLNSHV